MPEVRKKKDIVTKEGRENNVAYPLAPIWEEGLRCLFDGLIERLRRQMAILTEDLDLGEEHALCEREERRYKF